MKKKLPMQQLIEWINKNGMPKNELQLKEFDDELTQLISVEKEGIVEAVDSAYELQTGEEYFNDTYES